MQAAYGIDFISASDRSRAGITAYGEHEMAPRTQLPQFPLLQLSLARGKSVAMSQMRPAHDTEQAEFSADRVAREAKEATQQRHSGTCHYVSQAG